MWKHKRHGGIYEGSYDYNKKTGKRFFELARIRVSRKEGKFKARRARIIFGNPHAAMKAGWTKVA